MPPQRQQAVHVDLLRHQPWAGHATPTSFLGDPALLPATPTGWRPPQWGAGCPRRDGALGAPHHPRPSVPPLRASPQPHLLFLRLILQYWTDTLPSFCLCRHLRQESNTGMFPGHRQSPATRPYQDILQDLRVPGTAAPTPHPRGADPWLFTTMKTLLEHPGCSELVP